MTAGYAGDCLMKFRPELNLRTHGCRVLRTLMISPNGLSYEPSHSWLGDMAIRKIHMSLRGADRRRTNPQ